MPDRVLFVGGPYDGTWREVVTSAVTVELPANPSQPVDLPLGLSPSVLYRRTTLELGDGQPPLVLYRVSTMTARQAVAWVLAGYGKEGA